MNKTMDLEFEAWARKMSMDLEYRNIPGVGQFYECPRTLLALEAWQASRAAIEVELREAYQKGLDASGEGWNAEYPGDCHLKESWHRQRDESLGLEVKP